MAPLSSFSLHCEGDGPPRSLPRSCEEEDTVSYRLKEAASPSPPVLPPPPCRPFSATSLSHKRSVHRFTIHRFTVHRLTIHRFTMHRFTIHRFSMHRFTVHTFTIHRFTMHSVPTSDINFKSIILYGNELQNQCRDNAVENLEFCWSKV